MIYWVRIQLGGIQMNLKKLNLLPVNIQLFADGAEGDDDIEIDVEDLFNDTEVPPTSTSTSTTETGDLTQAMTKRINDVRTKAERDTQDAVAKSLGYADYADLQKQSENNLIKQHGYNPEDLEKVLEPLLQKRLADDPRLKKLEALEEKERDAYILTQLNSINEATGQNLKLTDLPQATLDLWSKGIDLEKAYYATEGKNLINKVKASAANGSMEHLAPGATHGATKTRRLTPDEKAMYRAINPYITDEELSKVTTPILGKK